MNRDDLIEAYVENILDGMDWETLHMYAHEKLRDDLRTYTEEDLEEEVREFAPHLLGE